ncbi:MAG: hypothetical protein CL587_20930 [Alteromonadaceae bacterium]|nr:hypothetical protein [Alteromonadaceae bacterium]
MAKKNYPLMIKQKSTETIMLLLVFVPAKGFIAVTQTTATAHLLTLRSFFKDVYQKFYMEVI